MFKSLKSALCCSLLVSAAGVGLAGCGTAPPTPEGKADLTNTATNQLTRMENDFPGLADIVKGANAYVIFPGVNEGAFIVGAARGRGEAYQGGTLVGYADISRADVGLQIGGQKYDELLVFRTPQAFEKFTNNNLTFAASASAVILTSGAAAEAKWNDDVAVFQRAQGGAFAGAAIGGQRFTYKAVAAPAVAAPTATAPPADNAVTPVTPATPAVTAPPAPTTGPTTP